MEKSKRQPSPVIGSTKRVTREHMRTDEENHGIGVMPRLVQVGDVAYAQNKNNDRIIAAHYYGGVRESIDEVTISYYGMSAVKITTPKGLEIFIDPWKNPCDPSWGGIWYKMRMPMTHCDIGLVTHSHFDHNAYEMLDAGLTLKNFGGVYNFADFKITGILDKHIVETQSPIYTKDVIRKLYPFPNTDYEDWDNSILLIETGGLKIVHWGDNRQNPPQDVWDRLQDIDIAILPVSDDGRVLTPEWADKISKKMGAKVVIPTHYFIDGINIDGAGWDKSAIDYASSRQHTMIDGDTITVTPDSLKDYKNHILYFGNNVAFEIDKIEMREQSNIPELPEVKAVWENV